VCVDGGGGRVLLESFFTREEFASPFRPSPQTAASGITSVLAPSGVQAAKMQRARDLSAQLKTLLLLGLRAKEFERTAIDAIISEITAIGESEKDGDRDIQTYT